MEIWVVRHARIISNVCSARILLSVLYAQQPILDQLLVQEAVMCVIPTAAIALTPEPTYVIREPVTPAGHRHPPALADSAHRDVLPAG